MKSRIILSFRRIFGLHTREIRKRAGIDDQVVGNSVFLAAVSRNISRRMADDLGQLQG